MSQNIVRINKITLANFKNVKNGTVDMPSNSNKDVFSRRADILGIYGQNGSGKTSIIEAIRFAQLLISGEELPADTKDYIFKDESECEIDIQFSISEDEQNEIASYHVAFQRQDDTFLISHERLAITPRKDSGRAAESVLIDYHFDNGDTVFTPDYRFKKLVANNKKIRIDLKVAQAISIKSHQSFIFGKEGFSIFSQCKKDVMGEFGQIFSILQKYAFVNLFVISNEHSGPISMNLLLPVAFYLSDGKQITTGDLPIRIDAPSVITKRMLSIAQSIIDNMNIVLKNVIPGMQIEIHNFGEQLLENGEVGYKIELLSHRNDILIPLKYESEGIIKIVSFLDVLICVYNNPSMCLAIDELDSGVFEFLLGELLAIFSNGGKGQLIFTSHNLRALEMLDKKSVMFSTTNPHNRYIRLQNVQANNNIRDLYLRCLTIGGQKEEMYDATDSVAIGRAFRRAGKAVDSRGEN